MEVVKWRLRSIALPLEATEMQHSRDAYKNTGEKRS